MALHWDLTKIKNSDTLCWKPVDVLEPLEEKGKVQMNGFHEILLFPF